VGSGVGFVNFRTIIQSNVFAGASGNVVSAFANSFGNLNCHNPCEDGSGMQPGECTAEIDTLLAARPDCQNIWDFPCIRDYSSQEGGFCDLPPADRLINFGGQVIAVTDGQPGKIHLLEPASPFLGPSVLVGNTGDDPRRIRCLQNVCVVSNFGSDSLTLLQWDGLTTASIAGTVTVGDGPVGVDLKQVGENIAILSTGFNDSTYTVTTVAPDASVVSSNTSPAPDGCTNPGFAIWLANTDKVVMTCNSSNNYAVFTP
jgi:hypothetical protein